VVLDKAPKTVSTNSSFPSDVLYFNLDQSCSQVYCVVNQYRGNKYVNAVYKHGLNETPDMNELSAYHPYLELDANSQFRIEDNRVGANKGSTSVISV